LGKGSGFPFPSTILRVKFEFKFLEMSLSQEWILITCRIVEKIHRSSFDKKEVFMKNSVQLLIVVVIAIISGVTGLAIKDCGYPVVGFVVKGCGVYLLLAWFFNLPPFPLERFPKRRR
jgi:hypothetical protein